MNGRQCPVCRWAMKTESYEGVQIDVCVNRCGTWLDRGELKRIIANRETKFDSATVQLAASTTAGGRITAEEQARKLPCPVCGAIMPPVNYQGTTGVIINSCENGDGVWLDGKELEKIQIIMEGWEDKIKADPGKYSGLTSQVKKVEEARLAADLADVHPSSFQFVNALIRRVIQWTE